MVGRSWGASLTPLLRPPSRDRPLALYKCLPCNELKKADSPAMGKAPGRSLSVPPVSCGSWQPSVSEAEEKLLPGLMILHQISLWK